MTGEEKCERCEKRRTCMQRSLSLASPFAAAPPMTSSLSGDSASVPLPSDIMSRKTGTSASA